MADAAARQLQYEYKAVSGDFDIFSGIFAIRLKRFHSL